MVGCVFVVFCRGREQRLALVDLCLVVFCLCIKTAGDSRIYGCVIKNFINFPKQVLG